MVLGVKILKMLYLKLEKVIFLNLQIIKINLKKIII